MGVGKARARHDVAFRCGLGEGVGERRDPMRRDRHQDIDMGGREAADPRMLRLMLAAQFGHAGGDEDAAPARPAQRIEQSERRGETDRV